MLNSLSNQIMRDEKIAVVITFSSFINLEIEGQVEHNELWNCALSYVLINVERRELAYRTQ